MIKILEKNVADKIAAGESIDRPVSIIKELVENSIDANSKNIIIQIKDGGKSYIRVTDDGNGINPNEIEIAFLRHATNKIATVDDLTSIETLGFRGEALASICAVSRVEVITRVEDETVGKKIVVEGSEILYKESIGCPKGTSITVKDLFYNLPARAKFLSSANGESKRIIDMVSKIAISHNNIKITLQNGDTTLFTTQGKNSPLNSIISVYGKDIGSVLIPINKDDGQMKLEGFVAPPSSSAKTRSKQIFAVNGRVISSKILENALDIAFKEKLFHGRFPIAFLFLNISPDKLDVNIHPTKREIRFENNEYIIDFISKAIKQSLFTINAIPEIRENNFKEENYNDEDVNTNEHPYLNTSNENQIAFNETSTTFNDDLSLIKAENQALKQAQISIKSKSDDVVDIKSLLETDRGEIKILAPVLKPFEITDLFYIGILFNTYILTSEGDNFYLIDQHAAHERIFYEKLLNEYNSNEKLTQTVLTPLLFDVSAQVVSSENEWINQVSKMGYMIENFGYNTYIVREIPMFMNINDAKAFLDDVFKEIGNTLNLTDTKKLDQIIMKSCKSAIKGGDHLEIQEVEALFSDLKKCINPFSCPHGRPTFIRLTKYEIEKLFKRI